MKVRLTESQLHRIVTETVRKVVNEIGETPKGQYALGQVEARAALRADDAFGKVADAGFTDNYDTYTKDYNDFKKYGNTENNTHRFAYDKRSQIEKEEVGRDKRFKDEQQRDGYYNAMRDSYEKGFYDYLRKK